MDKNTHKIAIITGAAQGIGKSLVPMMANQANTLILLDSDNKGLLAVKNQMATVLDNSFNVTVDTYTVDVTQESEIKAAFIAIENRYNQLDILINAVGGSSASAESTLLTEDMTLRQWQSLLDLNLTSSFLCCRAAIPLMKKNHYGRIVNFSSIASHGRREKVSSAYAASKAGIEGFTRKLAREVAAFGITCNAVAPGITLTERIDDQFWRTRTETQKSAVLNSIPLGRLSSPEEQAHVAAFLASDAASYITGQIIEVSGGI